MRDHYLILGLTEAATLEEIRRAYRRLAREWHPDHHPGDPLAAHRFKEIGEAHWVLSDAARRAQYDASRRPPPPAQTPRPGRTGSVAANLGQFVGSLFTQFARPRPAPASAAPAKGQDLLAEIAIPFLLAARGGQQALTIKRERACTRCQGRGAEPETPVAPCGTCAGTGQVEFDQGSYSIRRPCHVCRGRGALPRVPCRLCRGASLVAEEKTLAVRIPPGIEPGTRLRLAGEGEASSPRSPRGDLYVTVRVTPHPSWRRQGADIHSEVSIDIAQAALGVTLSIDTLDGPVPLAIPAGTQPGSLFRLAGCGIVRDPAAGARGDHLVRVHVAVPKVLSEEAKRLLEKYAKVAGLS